MKGYFNTETILQFSFIMAIALMPAMAHASVESTLTMLQGKIINTILPLIGILGIAFAGLSFLMGSANARAHLMLALLGAVIGFGAPSIIAFIRGFVQ